MSTAARIKENIRRNILQMDCEIYIFIIFIIIPIKWDH